MKGLSLALGGGGLKGIAHTGVIKILENNGFSINSIAGSSAGGLWGGIYASGIEIEEMNDRFKQLNPKTMYKRDRNDGPSMLGLKDVKELMYHFLGEKTFNQMKIPFAVTSVDIDTGELIYLNSGKVYDAILATIAIPGVFPPMNINGRNLVDGGVREPVPVRLSRELSPNLPSVAVVLTPKLEEWSGIEGSTFPSSLKIWLRYIGKLRISKSFNIFVRCYDIISSVLTDMKLVQDKPDVIIRPDLPNISILDFIDYDELVKKGEQAGELAIPDLLNVTSVRYKMIKRLRNILST